MRVEKHINKQRRKFSCFHNSLSHTSRCFGAPPLKQHGFHHWNRITKPFSLRHRATYYGGSIVLLLPIIIFFETAHLCRELLPHQTRKLCDVPFPYSLIPQYCTVDKRMIRLESSMATYRYSLLQYISFVFLCVFKVNMTSKQEEVHSIYRPTLLASSSASAFVFIEPPVCVNILR